MLQNLDLWDTRGMLMCKYIFPAQLYSYISDSSRFFIPRGGTIWRRDVSLKITTGIKQKNVISKAKL